ncbi:hypothetical protein N7490_004275 [Penicillium lividum]|nr:hypothetical protein N7490_004275 [Penicillium lividum]
MVDRQDKEEEKDRQEKESLQTGIKWKLEHEAGMGTEGPVHRGPTYHNAVIPREDGKFVKTSDKIPPGSGVTRDKYPKG